MYYICSKNVVNSDGATRSGRNKIKNRVSVKIIFEILSGLTKGFGDIWSVKLAGESTLPGRLHLMIRKSD